MSMRKLKLLRAETLKCLPKLRMMVVSCWTTKTGGKYSEINFFLYSLSKIYNNLFLCIDFPDEWNGVRFIGNWTEQSAGGTPIKGGKEACDQWAINPQYIMEIVEKETNFFVSLGQPDGRLIPGLVYPFEENIHPVVFSIIWLDPEEEELKTFPLKGKKKKLSMIKEYREISMRMKLKKGRYAIVPSTKFPGLLGTYYLNIYFDTEKENVKLWKTKTPSFPIAEEEEDVGAYDDDVKKILQIK